MSHASGNVICGRLPEKTRTALFISDGSFMDPMRGPVVSTPVVIKHNLQQKKIQKAAELFEKSPFNNYFGPKRPELLIITSSACSFTAGKPLKC